jgi:hypothetical protein
MGRGLIEYNEEEQKSGRQLPFPVPEVRVYKKHVSPVMIIRYMYAHAL